LITVLGDFLGHQPLSANKMMASKKTPDAMVPSLKPRRRLGLRKVEHRSGNPRLESMFMLNTNSVAELWAFARILAQTVHRDQ